MISITAAQGLNRLVFLSQPLLTDLRFSGTARAELVASADQTDTNFGLLVVDYGTDERVQYTNGDGLRTKPLSEAPETCWGEANPAWGEDACYLQTIERRATSGVGADHEGHPRCPEPELVRDDRAVSWSASRTGSTSRCCPRTTSSRPDTGSASWSWASYFGVLEPRRPDEGEHHAERA